MIIAVEERMKEVMESSLELRLLELRSSCGKLVKECPIACFQKLLMHLNQKSTTLVTPS